MLYEVITKKMSFKSLKAIEQACGNQQKAFWEVVLEEDCMERMVTKQEGFEQMRSMFQSMIV